MSDDELIAERHGPVLVLRLNRPDARNALTPSLIMSIGSALLDAEAAEDVRVVVVTGTGDRAFCAGMDLRAMADGGPTGFSDQTTWQAYNRLLRGEVTVPVVGAANGSAVAGGLELLLGCDVVVLADHARIGLPEVKRGLIPAGGGTFLGTRIPLSVALELTLTGETVDAARAAALGLANAVVPADQVMATAMDYAGKIAANGPLAVRAIKELARLAVVDAPSAWKRLEHWQPVVFGSEDAREGAMAFMEKREPNWQGR